MSSFGRLFDGDRLAALLVLVILFALYAYLNFTRGQREQRRIDAENHRIETAARERRAPRRG